MNNRNRIRQTAENHRIAQSPGSGTFTDQPPGSRRVLHPNRQEKQDWTLIVRTVFRTLPDSLETLLDLFEGLVLLMPGSIPAKRRVASAYSHLLHFGLESRKFQRWDPHLPIPPRAARWQKDPHRYLWGCLLRHLLGQSLNPQVRRAAARVMPTDLMPMAWAELEPPPLRQGGHLN